MITEHDLQEAIAECQGKRNPDAKTCIMLAAFYTIRDHLYPEKQQVQEDLPQPRYSYSPAPDEVEKTIDYVSDTDFGRLIDGRNAADVWPIIDELVSSALSAVNPRLYDAFIRKLTP